MNEILEVKVNHKTLDVKFSSGKNVLYEDCWLRDNCRCSKCYHTETSQKAYHITDLPETDIATVDFNALNVVITWTDGHVSEYSANFLSEHDYKTWLQLRRLQPLLWNGDEIRDKVARVKMDKFLDRASLGHKSVFKSLLDYGVAFVVEVPATVEATELVCEALGGVQRTMFGGMWRFTSVAQDDIRADTTLRESQQNGQSKRNERSEHADTAYTDLALAVHNDNTYFTEAAGLQILHCLDHTNGSGGETLLMDGFYGATCLKTNHPEDFELLSSFDVEAEYIESGHHHRHRAPIIITDKNTGDLKQIRFNAYDRAPMSFGSGARCRAYYKALKNLASYLQHTDNQWKFKLEPGVVVVMDNFRVLHGRTAFTGKRVMAGSYVARSDWLDRARVLHLIN